MLSGCGTVSSVIPTLSSPRATLSSTAGSEPSSSAAETPSDTTTEPSDTATGGEPSDTATTTATVTTATTGPATGSTSTATSTATNNLACVAPAASVYQWLVNTGQRGPNGTSDVTMVSAGVGNRPDETWWVVGARVYTSTTPPVHFTVSTWLTNEPSAQKPSGDTWLEITSGWANVAWTGTRLTAGQAAQAQAIACLSDN